MRDPTPAASTAKWPGMANRPPISGSEQAREYIGWLFSMKINNLQPGTPHRPPESISSDVVAQPALVPDRLEDMKIQGAIGWKIL